MVSTRMVSNGTNGAEILAQSDLGANDFKGTDEAAVCVGLKTLIQVSQADIAKGVGYASTTRAAH